MQSWWEITSFAKANIEQRYYYIISILEASIAILNVIEIQV